eukprot:TRINITY_DN3796_c0_g1_i1.p1 TRINITY_DN3796_c0_g1~~TRINITY_DN3796_c0_g1_i1.p1  ORF type:complete len:182 (-),score=20.72 TRINITY_DN3796_c0_g1_i1:75-620(-)
MVNGHHLARALIEANIDSSMKNLFCEVLDNFSDMEVDDFWMRMMQFDYVWLYDQNGRQPLDPEFIPPLLNMQDDVYRSLAWMARDNGAYAKSTVPFADFMWANYYRSQITLNSTVGYYGDSEYPVSWTYCEVRPFAPTCFPNQLQALQNVLPVALKISKLPQASFLPGYNQGTFDPENCGK